MSDELTSVSGGGDAPAPETGAQAYSQSDAPQGDSEQGGGQALETGAQATGQTPGQQPQKINLFEHPDFQRYQAAQERQQAMLRQQAEEMRQQMRQFQMAGMDDFQRAQYETQELRQQLAQTQQEREYERAMSYREQEIKRIAETTGAPVEALKDAESPAAAWEKAVGYARQQGKRETARTSEANKPYMPQGGGNSDSFEEARRNRDPVAWVRAVRRGG